MRRNMEKKGFKVRTDLALEAREGYEGSKTAIDGVSVEEELKKDTNIKITKVVIAEESAAKALNKPIGTYLTLEAYDMGREDEGYHREISEELAEHILSLLSETERKSILVVGLGNREVTPDALGPEVVGNLCITRHLKGDYREYHDKEYRISGIIPGVMAQTGMETAEIVKGIVKETNPTAVIAIDALAARSTKRLNTTIQIADTGIHPGSGVGNHRCGLTKESLGIPTIAIGVPTVVDAATIVGDTMENLILAMEQSEKLRTMSGGLSEFNHSEKRQLILELLDDRLRTMFVTPKDIDETIKRISFTISEAINIAFS